MLLYYKVERELKINQHSECSSSDAAETLLCKESESFCVITLRSRSLVCGACSIGLVCPPVFHIVGSRIDTTVGSGG